MTALSIPAGRSSSLKSSVSYPGCAGIGVDKTPFAANDNPAPNFEIERIDAAVLSNQDLSDRIAQVAPNALAAPVIVSNSFCAKVPIGDNDNDPATPATVVKAREMAEGALNMEALSDPNECGGRLSHPICPTAKGHHLFLKSTSSLSMHTDQVQAALPGEELSDWRKPAPHVQGLFCVANPGKTATFLSKLDTAADDLLASDISLLKEPRFSVSSQASYDACVSLTDQVVLKEDDKIGLIGRVSASKVYGATDRHQKAYNRFLEALEQHRITVVLQPGELMIWPALIYAHRRGHVGESKRLLFRTYFGPRNNVAR